MLNQYKLNENNFLFKRNGKLYEAPFGHGDKANHLQNGHSVDICFYLEENTFHGHTTLQMNAQDIKLN